MKLNKILFLALVACLLLSSAAVVTASDFDWTSDFNLSAEADPAGFRARLATRFKLGDVEIDTVLRNVARPADAYMVFRFGEMSAKPIDFVLEKYRTDKSNGWGVLAKSLGIKPGSKDFHALKRGNDIYKASDKAKDKNKGKNKGKGKK